jgi:NAD-dependent deacetylase
MMGSASGRALASSVREALDAANSVVVLTGAGMSAESGIPTFRGPGGLWRNYSAEQLATLEAFTRDPKLVWEWYDWRRTLIRKAEPNQGHLALVTLERRKGAARVVQAPGARGATLPGNPGDRLSGGGFTLITQNVDGLHDRAGSRSLAKLHGDIWQVHCMGCGAGARNEEVPLQPLPPRCSCGALLRPGVVWFGEPLPPPEWEKAVRASARAQIFVVVGTSGIVHPAAGLAEIARRAGAKLAVVNPEPTPLDSFAEWVLRGPSGEILPELL